MAGGYTGCDCPDVGGAGFFVYIRYIGAADGSSFFVYISGDSGPGAACAYEPGTNPSEAAGRLPREYRGSVGVIVIAV